MARRSWIIAFMIIEFLGFIPVFGIFGLLSNTRFGKDFWPMTAIIWVAVYFLTALRLRFLRCPRCGKHYFDNFLALFVRGSDIVSLKKLLLTPDCGSIQTNS